MSRIHCHYNDCVIPDEGYCSAAAIKSIMTMDASPILLQKMLS